MSADTNRRWPLGRGIAAGIVAFAAGYLVTYLWQAPRVREALQGMNAILEFFGGDPIPAWKAVGWLFFNAHFVRTHIPGIGGPQTRNFIASGDFPALLYAVPVVLLLVMGFLLAWSMGRVDVREGALDGATITIGYLIAAVASVFLVAAARGDASIAPDTVTAVLLAGILYPVVLGAVGGTVAALVASSEGTRSETTAD